MGVASWGGAVVCGLPPSTSLNGSTRQAVAVSRLPDSGIAKPDESQLHSVAVDTHIHKVIGTIGSVVAQVKRMWSDFFRECGGSFCGSTAGRLQA